MLQVSYILRGDKLFKKRGYTLIEILITIMVISTLLAIGVPFYTVMVEKLNSDAILTSAVQNVFYLFSLARKAGFTFGNVVKINYEQRNLNDKLYHVFKAFIDVDTNGVPDPDRYIYGRSKIVEISFLVSEVSVTFRSGGNVLTSLDELYTVDGMFVKKTGTAPDGSPSFDRTYSNLDIELQHRSKKYIISISNDLPKIIEQ